MSNFMSNLRKIMTLENRQNVAEWCITLDMASSLKMLYF